MKKITNAVITSTLISVSLLFGVLFYLYGYDFQLAAGVKGKSTTSANDAIKLSAKEVKNGVYNWVDNTTGKSNPTLTVFAKSNNTIAIQNPTDTKHELIIDTGADVLPSSDDIAPHGIGQLVFNSNTTGTFIYHCAYHPFTMKWTIHVVKGPTGVAPLH
jgi:plastocyanin